MAATAANAWPPALLCSALPVRPYVHVALTAVAVLTYRGSICLELDQSQRGCDQRARLGEAQTEARLTFREELAAQLSFALIPDLARIFFFF